MFWYKIKVLGNFWRPRIEPTPTRKEPTGILIGREIAWGHKLTVEPESSLSVAFFQFQLQIVLSCVDNFFGMLIRVAALVSASSAW